MKNNNDFWFVAMVALFVIAVNTGWNIYMRIAVALSAIRVLFSVSERFRGTIND